MSQASFVPTRAAGLARLANFAPAMGRQYAQTRNHDLGPGARNNLSLLSPYVRHRMIEERELAAAALARHSAAAADKFLKEVCWRTYWKGWLAHRPGVWTAYRNSLEDCLARSARDSEPADRCEAATAGRTGIEGFDDWAQELVVEGYLANHARMWFASIWIFTLRLPWELGADFFLRHLMDADAASNTLSWRWVAGLHTPGKTYLARPDNIATYTEGRFRPLNLAARAEPVAGYGNPSAAPPHMAGPAPAGRAALLVTDEDMRPETLIPAGGMITAIAGVQFAALRSPLATGEVALAFTRAAMTDSLRRAQHHFAAPAQDFSAAEDPHAALVDWAAGLDVEVILTAQPPVGWTAPELARLAPALASAGKRLVPVGRNWDAALWPHATKGFFALAEKIPATLTSLGIGAQSLLF